jgi:hypothetical protein
MIEIFQLKNLETHWKIIMLSMDNSWDTQMEKFENDNNLSVELTPINDKFR